MAAEMVGGQLNEWIEYIKTKLLKLVSCEGITTFKVYGQELKSWQSRRPYPMLLLNIYPRTIECRCLNLTDANNYLYIIFSECYSGLLKNITCSLYEGRIFPGQEIRNYKFYQCPFVPRLAAPSKQCALATHDSASREVYIP